MTMVALLTVSRSFKDISLTSVALPLERVAARVCQRRGYVMFACSEWMTITGTTCCRHHFGFSMQTQPCTRNATVFAHRSGRLCEVSRASRTTIPLGLLVMTLLFHWRPHCTVFFFSHTILRPVRARSQCSCKLRAYGAPEAAALVPARIGEDLMQIRHGPLAQLGGRGQLEQRRRVGALSRDREHTGPSRDHETAAGCMWAGNDAARWRARRRRNCTASAPNLPPTSMPTTTSRQRRALSSSG